MNLLVIATKVMFGFIFLIAFVTFLIGSNVRWAFNSVYLYEFGFARHQVTRTTGLTEDQLSDAAQQLRDYFNSTEELLHVEIVNGNTSVDLYNQREVLHMKDVKELALNVYQIQEGCFLYLFLFVSLGFFILGPDFASWIRRLFIQASIITITLVTLLGVSSLVMFGPIFNIFHELSFRNNFWQLDPLTSHLIQMFPQPFWLDATLVIGVACILESSLVVIVLMLIGWWQRWRQRVAQGKAPQFI